MGRTTKRPVGVLSPLPRPLDQHREHVLLRLQRRIEPLQTNERLPMPGSKELLGLGGQEVARGRGQYD